MDTTKNNTDTFTKEDHIYIDKSKKRAERLIIEIKQLEEFLKEDCDIRYPSRLFSLNDHFMLDKMGSYADYLVVEKLGKKKKELENL